MLPEEKIVFISAAEQSADEHAAGLIAATRRKSSHVNFMGLAGPAMRAAGCRCEHDMTARSAMALAALRRVPEALRVLGRLRRNFTESRPDAAVLVDSPTLHLPIAKLCKRFGIPVLYYIAPQTWAWAPWRNRRIRARVDQLACIWPFEPPFFRKAGIPAEYVGHPTFERLLATQPDPRRIAELRDGAAHVLLLLPGSREHVVREVFADQLAVARSLGGRYPRTRILIAAANPAVHRLIEAEIARQGRLSSIQILTSHEDRPAAIRAADLALVASGTVTLEVAYFHTPMIVMYNSGRWAYPLFARWLITTPHLSLPNILAGRRIVPEFMPFYRSIDPIIAAGAELLATTASRERVRHDLASAVDGIIKPGAAENTAELLLKMLAGTHRRL